MIANLSFFRQSKTKGFTLLELLIVITILAILAVIIIFVLNPAETLKKSRDVQRMSDLATLKNAIALYATTVTSPDFDGSGGTFVCLSGTASTAKISYSSITDDPICTPNPAEGTDTGATFASDACYTAGSTASTVTTVDGNGWIPVNLASISGGSPISNLPVDPTNTSIGTTPSNSDKVYRYVCQSTGDTGKPSDVFEINAVLESTAFTSDDNKMAKDGGDNDNYYEIGTSLRLLGTGTAF